MSHTIRVLVVDDHAVVRAGLRAIVARESDITVVGEAADGASAADQADALHPDVVLLDMVMPGSDGLAGIEAIKRHDPAARILVLTSFVEGDKIVAALKAGALGYLLKDSSAEDLVKAIRDVFQGVSSIHPAIARELMREVARPRSPVSPDVPLSPRELEVLRLLARGMRNDDIASTLGISARTVGRHVGNILEKLQVANRTQAALHAHRVGLVPSDG